MFIYIGDDHVIESMQIICILDYQLIKTSLKFKNLVNDQENKAKVFGVQEDAKSIIITEDGIYFSPFSTLTLKKRDELYATMDPLDKE